MCKRLKEIMLSDKMITVIITLITVIISSFVTVWGIHINAELNSRNEDKKLEIENWRKDCKKKIDFFSKADTELNNMLFSTDDSAVFRGDTGGVSSRSPEMILFVSNVRKYCDNTDIIKTIERIMAYKIISMKQQFNISSSAVIGAIINFSIGGIAPSGHVKNKLEILFQQSKDVIEECMASEQLYLKAQLLQAIKDINNVKESNPGKKIHYTPVSEPETNATLTMLKHTWSDIQK